MKIKTSKFEPVYQGGWDFGSTALTKRPMRYQSETLYLRNYASNGHNFFSGDRSNRAVLLEQKIKF